MNPVWRRVQGDVDDTIVPKLNGVEDLLTAVAVEAHVWQSGVSPIVPITLDAAIADPVERTVVVQLGDATGWLVDAEVGVWFVDVEVFFAGGSSFTWPAGVPGVILVRADT